MITSGKLGLTQTATDVNDLIARATQKRWSPVGPPRDAWSGPNSTPAPGSACERRLKEARVGRFKPMADFEWAWPKQIHRPSVERVLTLEFVTKRENTILVAAQGLGKTMLAKNLVHEAVLAGHSARFITAVRSHPRSHGPRNRARPRPTPARLRPAVAALH